MIPSQRANQVKLPPRKRKRPFGTKRSSSTYGYEWNDLKPNQQIMVERLVKGSTYYFFGEVDNLERLRNCYMLHLRIDEVWSDYLQLSDYDVKEMFSKAAIIAGHPVARWKKTSGSIVYMWDPYGSSTPSKSNDPLDDLLRKKAAHRAAYVAHRHLLGQLRSELSSALELVGLTRESDADELKRVRRQLMLEWHPDKEAAYVAKGGKPAAFRLKSKQYTDAISRVSQYLAN